jgi:DNA-binding HxlR family transcriptional regulator
MKSYGNGSIAPRLRRFRALDRSCFLRWSACDRRMAARTERAPIPASDSPPPPTVPFQNCPIATSLGSLGRKWTLTVLRDIAFRPDASFNVILRENPGLLPRTLSLRLLELTRDGLILRTPAGAGSRRVYYRLTTRGKDLWPVLSALVDYGSRYHADRVFEDGRARGIEETFPDSAALMMGRLVDYARTAPAGPAESRTPDGVRSSTTSRGPPGAEVSEPPASLYPRASSSRPAPRRGGRGVGDEGRNPGKR